jgi:hypothetical protein
VGVALYIFGYFGVPKRRPHLPFHLPLPLLIMY